MKTETKVVTAVARSIVDGEVVHLLAVDPVAVSEQLKRYGLDGFRRLSHERLEFQGVTERGEAWTLAVGL